MTQPKNSSNAGQDADSARGQQELYGRREPADLDEGPGVGRNDDDRDEADAEPGRGQDASGQPSTARSGANTQ